MIEPMPLLIARVEAGWSFAATRARIRMRQSVRGARLTATLLLAALLAVQAPLAFAQSAGPRLIRDAEIEELIRDYAMPIFKAAHVNANAIDIFVINDRRFNAFVADGRRMFINAGALMQAGTPNEIIGVIAHETGHIDGGHLARLRSKLASAQTAAIIAILAGIGAAAAGGIASGNTGDAAQAGQAVVLGGQSIIERTLLAYQRTEEAAADRAAVRYLDATGQSAKGMVRTFERFADQALVSLKYIDPYVLSHPMPRERLSALSQLAASNPYFERKDPPALQLRHDLMRAKLIGFLEKPDAVLRRYPPSDTSLPARYARAIADYLSADLRLAIRDINDLLREQPNNPYFWELKGQALLESGHGREAVEPLRRAVQLAPRTGLIRMLYGQALLASDDPRLLDEAIGELSRALDREPDAVVGHRQLANAYGRKGDIIHAELASARAAFFSGDLAAAKHHASRVQKKAPKGSPLWLQADDIINFRPQS